MAHTSGLPTRRACLLAIAALPVLRGQTPKEPGGTEPRDWTCPMDPDVHLDAPGKCPRCGMRLTLKVPDRIEYPLELGTEPAVLRPGDEAVLTLSVLDPKDQPARDFQLVHEKLMHVFVVSEDLTFFAHLHPVPQQDGGFRLPVRLPQSGMYRLLADYYPSVSVPQLAVATFYVAGASHPARLQPLLARQTGENVTAALRLEPEQPTAGMLTRMTYDLEPAEGLEQYLGAWGHMLVASEDLVDLIHLHPFLVGGSAIQFNVIFPRPGLYKVWSQFQRKSVVNTVAFTIEVKEL